MKGLAEHVAKGDPRDVAAYCAFAWHHGWSTAEAATPATAELTAKIAKLEKERSGAFNLALQSEQLICDLRLQVEALRKGGQS